MAAYKRQCRARTAEYMHSVGIRPYPLTPVLDIVADHLASSGGSEVCQATYDSDRLSAMPLDQRRLLVGMAAALHAIGGWSATEVLDMGFHDNAPIPAALIARMMQRAEYGPLDSAMSERLSETLPHEEVNWLVCVTASLLWVMDCTPDMVREMDPQWTVDAP